MTTLHIKENKHEQYLYIIISSSSLP